MALTGAIPAEDIAVHRAVMAALLMEVAAKAGGEKADTKADMAVAVLLIEAA